MVRSSRSRPSLLALFIILSPLAAKPDEYRLGPQDRLRIKVVEWRATKAEYFDWAVLGGEYVVSASGNVALPLIGNLPAMGVTTNEFAVALAETLQKRAGLPNLPEAAVEIIQYRPIYVVGGVQKSGEYPYRPEMTVLQAVSLSGGFYQQTESSLTRLERDRVNAFGTYENLRLEIRRQLIRRARLAAELNEHQQITMPDELRTDADAPHLIAGEAAIMNARGDALRSQLAATAELKDLFSKEIESLTQKVAVQERQISLARKERQTISTLVDKGLAVSAREFSLERTLADLESKLLDYMTAMVRARQEISKSERDATNLKVERKSKVAIEIQETEAALEILKSRLLTAQNLINEVTSASTQLALNQVEAKPEITFWIVRRSANSTDKKLVDENAIVQPGDVVRVELMSREKRTAEEPRVNSKTEASNTHRPSRVD
jgi:protein involved in polysaccharide export with SLBB domain